MSDSAALGSVSPETPSSAASARSATDKPSEPPHNLADAVRLSAQRDPDAPALLAHDTALTWGQVDLAVDRLAAGLRALDLPADRAPARVAIALPNLPEFAIALFAALRAGLVAVPINPGYTQRELRHVLSDSAAAVLIGTGGVLDAVDGVRADLPALRHRYTPAGSGSSAPLLSSLYLDRSPEPAAGGGEDLAVLLYTSGTEGVAKGAMLTHRALIANHRQLERVQPTIVGRHDVVLLALPFFHAFGLNTGLGAIAWHGACGVLVERFDPAETLALIARHQVSVVTGVPQMYLGWSLLPELGESMSSVRVAISGAAPLDRATAARFLNATRHPIFQGYGLTESSPVVATALGSPVPKAGSIGRPLPGIEVRLVDRDGAEIARVAARGLLSAARDDFDDDAGGVPGTDPGEIEVRGANLFSGYWPDAAGGPGADGWWATADLAYADAEGDLFLVDRRTELILVNGFNVYPREVELVLTEHPAVAEAAVIGVPHPYTGQAVKAFVVLADAATVDELIAHCERQLARFKCPSVIEFVTELPHSATGKVRKGRLREEADG